MILRKNWVLLDKMLAEIFKVNSCPLDVAFGSHKNDF